MKKVWAFVILVFLFLTFTGCMPKPVDNSEELKEKDEKIATLEEKVKDLESKQAQFSTNNELFTKAINSILLLKSKDMNKLSQYIHPTKGLRFTPYFYVDVQNDLVLTAEEISEVMQNTDVVQWGFYNGSGEPIDLTFSDYYDRFVYDQDFANPQIIGNNVAIGGGNTIDNISEAYPDGYFIEFHFSQINPEFEGIDWESLRLVFEQYNSTWYLVGVIHGQWTI